MSQEKPAYKRILLKLSGEALMGDDQFGINRATLVRMVDEIAEVTRLGVEVAVVIGGGNIFRGVAGGSVGMDRATADYMGMLATVMNALALGDTMNTIMELQDHKSDEIVVHCRSGARSAQAQAFLMASGFTNVLNLKGGVMAWMDAFGSSKP